MPPRRLLQSNQGNRRSQNLLLDYVLGAAIENRLFNRFTLRSVLAQARSSPFVVDEKCFP
jgi:hypothetical protein